MKIQHIIDCPAPHNAGDCICDDYDYEQAIWRADQKIEWREYRGKKTQNVPPSFEKIVHQSRRQDT